MKRTPAAIAISSLLVLSGVVVSQTLVASASVRQSNATHSYMLELPQAYNPIAPKGGHDLYHCSLLNPRVSSNQMIVKTVFAPGVLKEDHHAILYYISPSQAAAARTLDNSGRGWTCFGSPLSGTSVADLGQTPWLAGWGPGHNVSVEPAGTGVPLPRGSLIVLQMHYNLLQGHWPDRTKVTLTTVDAATSTLVPIHTDLYPSAIDVPCPTGVTGTLCIRSASLNDIGRRFGSGARNFVGLLEILCHAGTVTPGNTSSCTQPVYRNAGPTQYIWAVTPHMHLLGLTMTVTLNPGTPGQVTLLPPTAYDFHYQRSYAMSSPIAVHSGDTLSVSCTYNPLLRGSLPFLKNLPPRYVMWADGSSDEMCLAILSATYALPSTSGAVAHTATNFAPLAPQWPSLGTNAQIASELPSMQNLTDPPVDQTSAAIDKRAQLQLDLSLCA